MKVSEQDEYRVVDTVIPNFIALELFEDVNGFGHIDDRESALFHSVNICKGSNVTKSKWFKS